MTEQPMYGPHHCPEHVDAEFYGRYIHRGETEVPTCPLHKDEVVVLVPSIGAKIDDTVGLVQAARLG